MRTHKEELQQQQAEAEQRLQRQNQEFFNLEMRKFRRRKLLQFEQIEQDQMRDASILFVQKKNSLSLCM